MPGTCAPASSPKFRVEVLPGVRLAARLKELHRQVESQLEWEDDLTNHTPEMHELLTIVLKIEQLREDPFQDAVKIPNADGQHVFVSVLNGGTFFHTVFGTQVWLMGAIFSVDGPDDPEQSVFSNYSITTLAMLLLRLRRRIGYRDDNMGHKKIETLIVSKLKESSTVDAMTSFGESVDACQSHWTVSTWGSSSPDMVCGSAAAADGVRKVRNVHLALIAPKNGRTGCEKPALVIVDKAATLNICVAGGILTDNVVQAGAKVIFLDDDQQLASLERGGLIAEMLIVVRDIDANSYWTDTARELLRGLLVYVATVPADRRTMAELRRIVTASEGDLTDTQAEIQTYFERGQRISARAVAAHLNRPERERGSVMSTVMQHTAWLDDPRLARSEYSMTDVTRRRVVQTPAYQNLKRLSRNGYGMIL